MSGEVSVRFRQVDGVMAVWILCDDPRTAFVDTTVEGVPRAFLFVRQSAMPDKFRTEFEKRFTGLAHGGMEDGQKFLNALYAISVEGCPYDGWPVPCVVKMDAEERDLVRSPSPSWADVLGQITLYVKGAAISSGTVTG